MGKTVFWELGKPDGKLVGGDRVRWWWGSWGRRGAEAFAVDVPFGGQGCGWWRRGGWG